MTLFLSLSRSSFISPFSFSLNIDSETSSKLWPFFACHHICWAFFHSLLYCFYISNILFLIYCSFHFPSHCTILMSFFPLRTNNSTLQPIYFCGEYFPFVYSFILIFFTMLFSIPLVPCSDLLALHFILCTQSIQRTNAKICNCLFSARLQNVYSVFISVTWHLPLTQPPLSSWNIALPRLFSFLPVILQTIYLFILSPQNSH